MPGCSESLMPLTEVRRQLAAVEQRLEKECERSETLQRQLSLRNAALDAGSSHFLIVDARVRERTIVYVNRAAARAHGYEPEELIGRSLSLLTLPGLIDVETQASMDAELAAGRQFRAEVEAVRRDGTTFWAGFTSTALRDETGQITHIVTVGADISARLEAESKRKELQEQLMNEMREREQMAIELRLAQKLESVGRLAAGLAHEINTPIQYVSDSVHFLRTGFDDITRLLDACRSALDRNAHGATSETAEIEREIDYEFLRAEFPRAFERTLDGTTRVADLVRAMKEFAHPDTSEHTPADLNHALQTTLLVCRNEYKYVARVVTDFEELPSVVCNVGELNQVFLNLIVNAAHGIQDSGKDVEQGCIRISTRRVGDSVEIAIADNGCGIAAANLDKIFDPFFTTKEVGRGTGQGLSIARTIVMDKHHGDIRVHSEPQVGTTFTVVLPIGACSENVA